MTTWPMDLIKILIGKETCLKNKSSTQVLPSNKNLEPVQDRILPRLFYIFCSLSHLIYYSIGRPASLHLEINLTLEIGQVLLSLLHAWGLDKDLDKVAISKLGLLKPKAPVSYGLMSKGGIMSLMLPTWKMKKNENVDFFTGMYVCFKNRAKSSGFAWNQTKTSDYNIFLKVIVMIAICFQLAIYCKIRPIYLIDNPFVSPNFYSFRTLGIVSFNHNKSFAISDCHYQYIGVSFKCFIYTRARKKKEIGQASHSWCHGYLGSRSRV